MFRLAAQSLSRRCIGGTAFSLRVSSVTRTVVTTSFKLPDPAAAKDTKALTKIVATIGPTSEQAEPLLQVTQAGMKIMRLNFSHATTEEVELRCTNLAAAEVSACAAMSTVLSLLCWFVVVATTTAAAAAAAAVEIRLLNFRNTLCLFH